MKILGNEKLRQIAIVLLIIASLAVIVLSVAVHYHAVFGLDVYLSRDLQGENFISRSFDYKFFYVVSLFGRPAISAVMILVFALLFWFYRYFRETVFCLLTSLSALINFIIKLIVNRPRPSESLVQVIDRQLSPSFPSGHVVFYTVFFGFLIVASFFTKKIPRPLRVAIVLISLSMIVLVSFSRIYLGAHWVTDVVGGYLTGTVLLSILLHYYLKPYIKS